MNDFVSGDQDDGSGRLAAAYLGTHAKDNPPDHKTQLCQDFIISLST